jgi:macrolide-specific efflux system membrane fusion protein
VFFVVAEAKDAVLVPLNALSRGNTVTVLGEDGKAEPRQVKLGVRNRIVAQVVEGLQPGERVATTDRAAPRNARDASAARTPKMGPRL